MRNRYSSLDGVRAIAVIMVLLSHFNHWVDFCYAEAPVFVGILKYTFQIAVQIFFVLSGLALGLGYYNRLNTRNDTKRYYIRRFFRIVPLYLVLILIWGLNDFSKGQTYSVMCYLGNITFMFHFIPDQSVGIVGGFGWTLGVLFVLYLIFPILVLFIRKIKIAVVFLVGLLIFSSMSMDYMLNFPGIPIDFANTFFVLHLPYFVLGILLYLILRDKIGNAEFLNKTRTKIIGVVLLVSSIIELAIFSTSHTLAAFFKKIPIINLGYYVWLFVVGSLIVGVVFFPWKGLVNRVTKFIADRSYSIYMIHPCLLFYTKPVPDAIFGSLGYGFLGLTVAFLFFFMITLGASILSYKYIEQPMMKHGPAFFLKQRVAIKI